MLNRVFTMACKKKKNVGKFRGGNTKIMKCTNRIIMSMIVNRD